MKWVYFLCVFLFFINVSYATLFNPLSFEKQILEANSAAEVKLDRSHSFRDGRGMIMTEYRFNVVDSYGLDAEDLDAGQLIITMVGGSVDGVTSFIDGAPKFEVGKRNFLLLKKLQSKFYLSNFTLGQFDIVFQDGKEILVSTVFPRDPNVGRISKDKLVEMIKEKWKISFGGELKKPTTRYIIDENKPFQKNNRPRGDARSPAQADSKVQGVPWFFWWALALVTGFFTVFFIKLSRVTKVENKNDN